VVCSLFLSLLLVDLFVKAYFYCLFVKVFFLRPFLLFKGLAFYCLFSFFRFGFLSLFVFPLLFALVLSLFFLTYVVSSLAYPNLLGIKRLGCCCFSCPFYFIIYLYCMLARGAWFSIYIIFFSRLLLYACSFYLCL
jgi:hypothetical protein